MQSEQSNANKSEAFFSGSLDRIRALMVHLAVLLTAAAWLRYGGRTALGLALGCAVSYLNFYWLKRVVNAMAERITRTGRGESGAGIVLRFLLRYFLMGLAAYAILTFSPLSLYGFLTGLFLPVGAIVCEAGYEVWAAVARGV